jgi:hypothetical protein
MNDKEQEMHMGFTQEVLPECDHVCLIYDNEEQRRKIVSEFLAAGLKRDEFVGYFADTAPREDVLAWLSETGVDFLKAEENGAFGVVKAEDAYCPSGRFVPQEVLDRITARYNMLRQTGYTGSRVTGEMTWVLRDIPDTDRFLEYEVGLNMITDPFPHIGMCQYDARLFDGAMLFKVLQVHPYMIAQGKVVRNPYYIKPEEFMSKL